MELFVPVCIIRTLAAKHSTFSLCLCAVEATPAVTSAAAVAAEARDDVYLTGNTQAWKPGFLVKLTGLSALRE